MITMFAGDLGLVFVLLLICLSFACVAVRVQSGEATSSLLTAHWTRK